MKKLLLMSLLLASGVAAAEPLKEGVLTNVRPLTGDAVKYENPRWSPDGTKIAFTNYGYNNLYVMDASGANKHMVSDADGVGFGYEWSGDSCQILATDLRYEVKPGRRVRRQALWAYSLDGASTRMTDDVTRMTQELRLSSTKYKGMRSRSKAQTVTFSCEPEGLFVINAAGVKTLINKGASFCPALSPDGKKVAFAHRNDICVMNIDGTGKKVIARGFNPVWANNSQIVFEQSTDDGHTYTSSELYIANVDGTGLKALTATADRMEVCPSISPDGTKIVFTSFTDGQIYTADFK